MISDMIYTNKTTCLIKKIISRMKEEILNYKVIL